MSFRLQTPEGVEHFDNDASYSFNSAGMLVIRDGKGRQVILSPVAWNRIEEAEPRSGMVGL